MGLPAPVRPGSRSARISSSSLLSWNQLLVSSICKCSSIQSVRADPLGAGDVVVGAGVVWRTTKEKKFSFVVAEGPCSHEDKPCPAALRWTGLFHGRRPMRYTLLLLALGTVLVLGASAIL